MDTIEDLDQQRKNKRIESNLKKLSWLLRDDPQLKKRTLEYLKNTDDNDQETGIVEVNKNSKTFEFF